MTKTEKILKEKGYSRNPNGTTVLFEGCDNLPIGATWLGKYHADVIATEYGFKIFDTHGYLCPPTEIQFPKYATEDNFVNAYSRMAEFLAKNYPLSGTLPAYAWGD